MTIFLFLLAGLVLLVVGGDALVRGAERMALRFGVSPLLIDRRCRADASQLSQAPERQV